MTRLRENGETDATHVDRYMDGQTGRQMDVHTDTWTDMLTQTWTDRWAGRQADELNKQMARRQMERQRQTEITVEKKHVLGAHATQHLV